jgi:predicted Fe-S protein YdhL (DUF1289 family)
MTKLVTNPCISICKVVDGVCTGCNRTKDEIRGWNKMTTDQRSEVIIRIAQLLPQDSLVNHID